MLKKTIFLSLALTLASGLVTNNAFAGCIQKYQKRFNELTDESLTAAGAGAMGGLVSGGIALFNPEIRNGALTSAGGLVAAGGVASTVQISRRSFVNNVISLLMESQIGQGLYLVKFTKETNAQIKAAAERNTNKSTPTFLTIAGAAAAINDLNENNVLCTNDRLLSEQEIREVIIANLNE